MRSLRHLAAACAVLVCFANWASAQSSRSVRKVNRLNKQAMKAYDDFEYDKAKELLLDAVKVGSKGRLKKHEALAKTYLNLAIVEFSGLENKRGAAKYLALAVAIDSGVSISPAYATDELESALSKAKTSGSGSADQPIEDPEEDPEPSVDCRSVRGLQHDLVEEAIGGQDVKIVVHLGRRVKPEAVLVYFRSQGSSDFDKAELEKDDGCSYTGTIPARSVRGGFVHYYVAAVDDAGEVVAKKGSVGSPNIIDVTGAQQGDDDDSSDCVEDPLVPNKCTDNNKSNSKGKTVFIALSAGSGAGFVSGATEIGEVDIKCCVAVDPMHVFAEIGYFISPQTAISVAGRLGFPLGANVERVPDGGIRQPATGSPSAMVRVRHALNESGSGLLINGALGGGVLRRTVKLDPASGPGMDVDTAVSGPLLLGVGAAYRAPLSSKLAFLAELNGIAGVPLADVVANAAFGFQIDVNLGLEMAF